MQNDVTYTYTYIHAHTAHTQRETVQRSIAIGMSIGVLVLPCLPLPLALQLPDRLHKSRHPRQCITLLQGHKKRRHAAEELRSSEETLLAR